MNKKKYIHAKTKYSRKNYRDNSDRKPKHKPTCVEDYEILPIREPMRKRNYWWDYYDTTQICFYGYLRNRLKESIGEYWDDIYSDLITKTKPKYRYILEQDINWTIEKVVLWKKEVPYRKRYWRDYSPLTGKVFLDKEGKIRIFHEEEDLLKWAKIKHIEKKLERILKEDLFI